MPRHRLGFASHMAIRSGLGNKSKAQFQTLLDRFRTHIEDIPDLRSDLSVRHIHLRTAKSIHENILSV